MICRVGGTHGRGATPGSAAAASAAASASSANTRSELSPATDASMRMPPCVCGAHCTQYIVRVWKPVILHADSHPTATAPAAPALASRSHTAPPHRRASQH